MKRSILIAASTATLLIATASQADSLHIHDMPLPGDYGGRYGHTIIIDGKICHLRNSAGFSAPQGCNYDIRAGLGGDETLHSKTTNNGCSVDCEPSAVRQPTDQYEHLAPKPDIARVEARRSRRCMRMHHDRARCRPWLGAW